MKKKKNRAVVTRTNVRLAPSKCFTTGKADGQLGPVVDLPVIYDFCWSLLCVCAGTKKGEHSESSLIKTSIIWIYGYVQPSSIRVCVQKSLLIWARVCSATDNANYQPPCWWPGVWCVVHNRWRHYFSGQKHKTCRWKWRGGGRRGRGVTRLQVTRRRMPWLQVMARVLKEAKRRPSATFAC